MSRAPARTVTPGASRRCRDSRSRDCRGAARRCGVPGSPAGQPVNQTPVLPVDQRMTTDRRPLGLPVFTSPHAEDTAEPASRRRLPVEQGARFLEPPAVAADASPRQARRVLGDGGLTFSAAADRQP